MADLCTLAEEPHLRMVLLGKTGAGKSAAGNTILGKNAFESLSSFSSVTTRCRKETGECGGQTLAVVDTPGLFDTTLAEDEVKREIVRCISFAAPGPHAFLAVIQIGRFTKEEQETVKILQKLFGDDAACYTIALITHGDNLSADGGNIEELITGNEALRRFIGQCGDRYQVFDNRSKDPAQVRELLKKVNTMVQRNGGTYYINEMFVEAERAIEKRKTWLLKKNPQMAEQEARRRAEVKNRFIKAMGIGAGVGSVLGPVGAALGAVLGAAGTAARHGECGIL